MDERGGQIANENLKDSFFSSLWSMKIDGFGNYDQRWPNKEAICMGCLHPGRPWVDKPQQNPKTEVALVKKVKDFIAQSRKPGTTIKIPKKI